MPNGKRRLLTVVLGTASREARAAESQKLLNWGWQAWDSVRLFDAGAAIATVPVWKGKEASARLGAERALFVSVPKGEGAKLKTSIERTDPLVAPLTKGQRVGRGQSDRAGSLAELRRVCPVGLDPGSRFRTIEAHPNSCNVLEKSIVRVDRDSHNSCLAASEICQPRCFGE